MTNAGVARRKVAQGSGWLVTALAIELLVACGGGTDAEPSAPQRLAAESGRQVPIGLCEDYPPESTTPATLSQDLRLVRKLGARVLRVSFGWDDLEPERGRYDWSSSDQMVALAEQYGVELIPYVCYTPAWAATDPGPDFWRSPPRDENAFAEFMSALASRYRGRIASWELWNEPDNQEYWTGSAEQYARLAIAGADAVRRADPEARVVSGGIAGELDFLREAFAVPGFAQAVDVVNLHSYAETWWDHAIETIPAYVQAAAEILETSGEGEPLWMAEVGYSSFRRGRHVSEWYEAEFDYEHTPAFQAVALVRIVTLLLSSAPIELVAWYELKDLPPTGEVIGDVNNRHLGLLWPDRRPKPALAAFAFVQRLFDGPFTVRRAVAAGPEVQIHAFERGDGRLIVVAWLPTVQQPRKRSSASADTRHWRGGVLVETSRAYAETPMVLDALGRSVGARVSLEQRDEAVALTGVELRGGQVRVLVAGGGL
ncbi:MAG TPA: beta-galactosidase [Polyangiaceae bacterium]|nr:beta-galactosidase [Polyangiaceae bacterium]